MAYKRNVDPADLLDEKYQNLSVLAKYLKAYIPCFCDCYGFINYNEKMIYSFIFPTKNARFSDVKRALSELIKHEFLIKVDTDLGQKLWATCFKHGQFLHGSDKKRAQHRNNQLYKIAESLKNGESFSASNIEHRTENIENRIGKTTHSTPKKRNNEFILPDGSTHELLNSKTGSASKEGESYLSGNVIEDRAFSLDGEKIKNLVDIWQSTLDHFGVKKSARFDELQIARVAAAHGYELTALALEGARYESGFKDFDPAKNISIRRGMKPDIFDKWANLAAMRSESKKIDMKGIDL